MREKYSAELIVVELIMIDWPVLAVCHSEKRSDEESGVGPFHPSPDSSLRSE